MAQANPVLNQGKKVCAPLFPLVDSSFIEEDRVPLAHSLGVRFIMEGKPWQQEHEAAGHMATKAGRR